MKAKHLFWGLLFISLGILVLINNFSGLQWNWIDLWKLWPLLFILWGLGIMVKDNSWKILIAGIAGIIFAITLFASFKTIVHLTTGDFNVVFDNDSDSDYKYDLTEYAEPYKDNIKAAVFHFKAGAGTFTSATDSASNLFYAHTEGAKNNYELNTKLIGDQADIQMKMKETRFRFGKHSIRNRVEMYFNPTPLWDLNFDVGAASVDLDLTKVKVRNLNVGMGAASFKVNLGNTAERSNVNIESGVSSVELNIPESTGCEIITDGALNSKDFEGFTKISSDHYRTENFDKAQNKIFINIDSGVSSIKIKRYSNEW